MNFKSAFLLSCVCFLWLKLANAEEFATKQENNADNAKVGIQGSVTNSNIFISLGVPKNEIKEWQMISRYQVKDGLVIDTVTGLMWMRCSLGQNWDRAKSKCEGKATEYLWNQAIKVSKNINYEEYNDWRLPTIQELQSLVYCGSVVIGWKDELLDNLDSLSISSPIIPKMKSSGIIPANCESLSTLNKRSEEFLPAIMEDIFPQTPYETSFGTWSSSEFDVDQHSDLNAHDASNKDKWFVSFSDGITDTHTVEFSRKNVRLVRSK